jgi:colanic acid biosynthesis glycosyl transferase WcaI
MADRAVRVVILGINYAPELTGIAPYTTGIAMGLVERGHEVLVLTGHPHYPHWKRDATGKSRFRSQEYVDGVRVRRLKHPVPRRLPWIGRAAMELIFGLQLLTTRWGRPEVVICVTPPLLAATMSVLRARLTVKRPALGILVQDLYSRGVAEMGTASALTTAVRAVESLAMRLCDSVAVIHAGFATDVNEHLNVDRRRIREIRNWTHVGPPDPSSSVAFRTARGWGADDVVVMHAGNMGFKQGLENVVAAAALATDTDCRARFVLLGDGNQRASLQASAVGVGALEFLPPVAEEDFPAALGAADVLLVNERPGIARMSVPSKLTSYFNSGKPIVAATDATGLTAAEVAASGAGVSVPADRPDLLLSEAIRLGTNRQLARQLGEAGRRYCEELLTREAALDRYEQWIVELADMRRAGHRRTG